MSSVYRDIKPDNVLLENNQDIQQLKLADFGSATDFSNPENPELKKITGTEIYMAPEVLIREEG
jgi:serine/threonine protein kinase